MAMPTELRKWLKVQMRAIENKTLDTEKTMIILNMLMDWRKNGHCEEVSEIIDELAEEKKKTKKTRAVRTPQ
jgi:hypothetical protein